MDTWPGHEWTSYKDITLSEVALYDSFDALNGVSNHSTLHLTPEFMMKTQGFLANCTNRFF